jgi:DNA mismatch repair protein MutS
MASFLHEHPERPLCLFATHYHELNEMSEEYPRIQNMNVAVREEGEKIHFLRKLQEGGSAHSFGIQVARMAGMPQFVLKKAEQLLAELEKSRSSAADEPLTEKKQEWQLSMIQMQDPLLEEIRSELDGLDLNNLTPIEALMVLKELQAKTKQS